MVEKIHVALVANERYRPGLECTKTSMIRACAEPERLVFHEYGDADMTPFVGRVEMRDFNGSKLPYLRLFLAELLPDCDWVLYADVDTLWFRDPCELWEERDELKSVCWVQDLDVGRMVFERWAETHLARGEGRRLEKYACSGVALINLKRWREMKFAERAVEFLKTYGCPPYPDQDLMNVLLAKDAKFVDGSWDTMIPPRRWRPCVLHITGIGRHLTGSNYYDGTVPQYVFWFNYWRQNLLGLPKMKLSWRLRGRFASLVVLSWTIGLLLDLADRLSVGYAWKMAIMRLRRQLGWARFAF